MKKILFFLVIFLLPFVCYGEEVVFKDCVDGDTAKFYVNDEVKTVRFLAIDTPEIKHGNVSEEPYGKKASDYTCDLLMKTKKFVLEYDDNSDKYDKYGRLLAWVFVDNFLLQKKIVGEGLAEVAYLYGDYKYTDELIEVQNEAKNKKINLWSDYEVDYSNYYILGLLILIIIIICIVNKKFRKKLLNKGKSYVKKETKKTIKKIFKC